MPLPNVAVCPSGIGYIPVLIDDPHDAAARIGLSRYVWANGDYGSCLYDR